MDDSCIMVYTSRSVEEMLASGGSQAWKLGAAARRNRYLVCTWNPVGEFAQPNTRLSHGEGFLIAPISAIETAPAPEDPQRFIIRFNEYARIALPDMWNHQRNPFAYTTLQKLHIDASTLKFEPVPALEPRHTNHSAPKASGVIPMTIAQAKEALSANYGVQPQAIEITIRG